MTHFRLTLTKGRGRFSQIIAERHSFSSAFPSGWYNSVAKGSSVHLRACWVPDEACVHLNRPPPIPLTPGATG